MAQFSLSLLDFQQALVYSATTFAALGIVLIGFGMVVSTSAPVFGYRVKRLGLQTLGAVVLVLLLHVISSNYYNGTVPVALLLAVYGIVALMLMQGVLNLLFGPIVGGNVTSRLLSGLILLIAAIAFASYSGLFP